MSISDSLGSSITLRYIKPTNIPINLLSPRALYTVLYFIDAFSFKLATRWTFTKYYEHISPSFEDLSWLRINDRRTLHSLVLLLQILRTSSSNYLASRFHILPSNHDLTTRSQHNSTLSILYHRTSLYFTSCSMSSSRYWNSLSLDIRICRTLAFFKRLVNNLLLSSVENWIIIF